MITGIIPILARAQQDKLTARKVLTVKDDQGKDVNIILSPHGRSSWAHWVKEGLLKPEQVIWAFTRVGKRLTWIGFSVSSGRRPPTILDLQIQEERDQLVGLENKTREFFKAKRIHDALCQGYCPKCKGGVSHHIDRETGDIESCCDRCGWTRVA